MGSPDRRFRRYNIFVKYRGRWMPVEGNTGRGTDHTLAGVKSAYLAKHPALKPASVKVEREKRNLREAMSPSKRKANGQFARKGR